MFRNLTTLMMFSLVLVLAVQAQGQTLLSYWPMNDGLSNPTSTICTNYGSLNTTGANAGLLNAYLGVATSNGTTLWSSTAPPKIAIGTTALPYNAGGYSSTYSAGGSTYTLPQWSTSGPNGFGYSLTFSGYNGNLTATSTNWGLNFVAVAGGSTGDAGIGGGGISAASNFTMSMWVQWNGTQTQAIHSSAAGAFAALGTNPAFGQVMSWNAASVFSNSELGLSTSSPTSTPVWSTTTGNNSVMSGGTVSSGWTTS